MENYDRMVEGRGMFPSPKYRQCTSDLKRGPIEKAIRHYLKDNPRFNGLIVNCMGMRAQESSKRRKLTPFAFHKDNSIAGREWYEFLPIHKWSENEVFDFIAAHGQTPHWVYGEGMSRKSCAFCIMSNVFNESILAKDPKSIMSSLIDSLLADMEDVDPPPPDSKWGNR